MSPRVSSPSFDNSVTLATGNSLSKPKRPIPPSVKQAKSILSPKADRLAKKPVSRTAKSTKATEGPKPKNDSPLDLDFASLDTPTRPAKPRPHASDSDLQKPSPSVNKEVKPKGRPRKTEVVEAETEDEQSKRFLELRIWSDTYYQLQKQRIMVSNRLSSGVLPPDIVADLLDDLKATEKRVGLAMKGSFRKTMPILNAWVKTEAALGIGEHLMARLIGAIGHPLYAQPHHWEGTGSDRKLVADEPFKRNVAKLWQYCGMGDPTIRRKAGQSAEEVTRAGNPKAKMLIRLIAEGTIKCVGSAPPASIPEFATQADTESAEETISLPIDIDYVTSANLSTDAATSIPEPLNLTASVESSENDDGILGKTKPTSLSNRRRSPYRDIYDAARIYYADHEGWTLMHQHNAALRKVSKEILKDIWVLCNDHELKKQGSA